jgi:hypothetical protein
MEAEIPWLSARYRFTDIAGHGKTGQDKENVCAGVCTSQKSSTTSRQKMGYHRPRSGQSTPGKVNRRISGAGLFWSLGLF